MLCAGKNVRGSYARRYGLATWQPTSLHSVKKVSEKKFVYFVQDLIHPVEQAPSHRCEAVGFDSTDLDHTSDRLWRTRRNEPAFCWNSDILARARRPERLRRAFALTPKYYAPSLLDTPLEDIHRAVPLVFKPLAAGSRDAGANGRTCDDIVVQMRRH